MDALISTLRQWISESRSIVFFGGAGVSTESGIPDFRSVDGLYGETYAYPPETILSRSFFERDPAVFFQFHREKLLVEGVLPNAAHRRLAELEAEGRLRGVVTQNIDGLHQMAGSETVKELHGSIWRNYCVDCRRQYDLAFVKARPGIPRCACGGIVRPDVVLYEEPLDQPTVEAAVDLIREADLLIVGGTSLVVYPAAGLVTYYRGRRLVLINRDETALDRRADLVIRAPIGRVFSAV